MSRFPKITISDAKRLAKKKAGKVLSSEIKNAHSKLHWQCKRKHKWHAQYANVRNGTWCPECAGRAPISPRRVLVEISKQGHEVKGALPKSIRAHTKIRIVCSSGHPFVRKVSKIFVNKHCPSCPRKKYTDELLLSIVKRVATEMGRPPTQSEILKKGKVDPGTIKRRFGSWSDVLRAAGIEVYAPTKGDCISALKKYHADTGTVPSRQEYNSLGLRPTSDQFKKHFPSWSSAIEAAGMKPRTGVGGRSWKTWQTICEKVAVALFPDEKVVTQFCYDSGGKRTVDIYLPKRKVAIDAKQSAYLDERHTAAQTAAMLSSQVIERVEFWCCHPGAYRDEKVAFLFPRDLILRINESRLSSRVKQGLIDRIRHAEKRSDKYLKESGLPTKQELVSDIVSFKEENGRFPKQREFKPSNGLRSAATYAHYFSGGLTDALISAGAPPPKAYWKRLSTEELIKKFRELVSKQYGGKPPPADQLHGNVGYPALKVFVDRVGGSYPDWLKRCGYEPIRQKPTSRSFSDEEALDLLAKAYSKSGKPLKAKDNDFHRFLNESAPPHTWYAKRFGSWNTALTMAGLPITTQPKGTKVTKKEALEMLFKLEAHLARPLKITDLHNKELGITSTRILKAFGSWSAAKKAFLDEKSRRFQK